jgi:hypothetical protein
MSLDSFVPHVGTRFSVRPDGAWPVRVTLVEAERLPSRSADRPGLAGDAFSLIFANDGAKAFDQGTHMLAHPGLGQFPLFLVPVGIGRRGQHYQAIYNRRVPLT